MFTQPLTALPPLSLYIHIPWCIQKCPYCDFNSHKIKTTLDENAYIQALLTDLQSELPYFWGRPIDTIFIGGGTPSVFSAKAIDQLLSGIRALVKLNPEAEITLEANPSTFEIDKFQGFKDAGINRLSIGVQSFDDAKLKTLGRIHNAHEAKNAIEVATQIFERVNIDLMYALPHQTVQAACDDIRTAIAFGTTHISAYQLTLEPNTPFGHTPPQGLPEDDNAQDIEDAIHAELAQAGFVQYETSAFAKSPNQQARHNVNYWQFGDYIGIGAGAHGKLSHHDRIERTTRKRHPSDYLLAMQTNPHDVIERKIVAPQDLPFEFMMNALRLVDGVPSVYFGERTGVSVAKISQQIKIAQQKGLLDSNPMFFRPTNLGRRFLNDLIEIFL
ncbi:radical SAM family heme chaperone HemW [Kingella kingae]|uniref:radical SAM family heme chaperone HemW n=1 Tax=Kingella kingae TaxID=504 RepID=UPI000413701A|nr:radical SAM family heme chaperone HemW [Kingella kingae]MDK4536167.1 radical SAM family heme chaperone HemW [Kingella kingae]MDK4538275.1 radical SAM family heme chaperone HemW [Kingella kingae]MDK4545919.1 radical SAM family heme chaperone HemW [Kingella kingae]MDK4595803.1 radical SAM family heme chaperone HemW [Kingella kingae]MDK4599682.1 radical SAM family heme chaperone HemW [Kingella kingae]